MHTKSIINEPNDNKKIKKIYKMLLKDMLVYSKSEADHKKNILDLAEIYRKLLICIDDPKIFSQKKGIVLTRLYAFQNILKQKNLDTQSIEIVITDIVNNANQLKAEIKDQTVNFKSSVDYIYNDNYPTTTQIVPSNLRTSFYDTTNHLNNTNVQENIYKEMETANSTEKIDSTKALLKLCNDEGILLFRQNKLSQSISKYNEALNFSKTLTLDNCNLYKNILNEIKRNLVIALDQYARIFVMENSIDTTIQQTQYIITLLNEIDDNDNRTKHKIVQYHQSIGNMYQQTENYQLAESHYIHALTILESPQLATDKSDQVVNIKSNLCKNDMLIANKYCESHNYDEAMPYYKKAFSNIESLKNSFPSESQYFTSYSHSAHIYYLIINGLSQCHYKKGILLANNNVYSLAIDELKTAISLAKKAFHTNPYLIKNYIDELINIETNFINSIINKYENSNNVDLDNEAVNNNNSTLNNNNNNYISIDTNQNKRKHEIHNEEKSKKQKITDTNNLILNKIFSDADDVIRIFDTMEVDPEDLLKLYKNNSNYNQLINKFENNFRELSNAEKICYCLPLFYCNLSDISPELLTNLISKLDDEFFIKLTINFKIMLSVIYYSQVSDKERIIDQLQSLLNSKKEISSKNQFYEDLNLSGAQLPNIHLPKCDFNFANLASANFEGANLTAASLTNTTLNEVNFSNAVLNGVNFMGSSLDATDFTSANLQNANLSQTSCSQCDFTNADLKKANLQNACLSNSLFDYTDFTDADLTNAQLFNTVLEHANLTRANLTGAKFFPKEIVNINNKELFQDELLSFLNESQTHPQRSKLYDAVLNNIITLLDNMDNVTARQDFIQLTSETLQIALKNNNNTNNEQSQIIKISLFKESNNDVIRLLSKLAAYSWKKTISNLDMQKK